MDKDWCKLGALKRKFMKIDADKRHKKIRVSEEAVPKLQKDLDTSYNKLKQLTATLVMMAPMMPKDDKKAKKAKPTKTGHTQDTRKELAWAVGLWSSSK